MPCIGVLAEHSDLKDRYSITLSPQVVDLMAGGSTNEMSIRKLSHRLSKKAD
jgi:hypothetical protein